MAEKKLTQHIQKTKDIVNPTKPIPTVSQPTFTRRRYVFGVSLVIITISLSVLTYFAKLNPYFPFDLTITRAIQTFHPAWFDLLMKFITAIGQAIPGASLLIVVAAFIFFKGRQLDAFQLVLSTLGLELIGVIMKIVVGRNRPDPHLITRVYSNLQGNSFPSGHVLYYMGFFGFLLFLVVTLPPKHLYRRVLIIVLSLLIVLVGPSRIYLGAHWFSDVLGAYLMGSLWLTLMVYLHQKLQPQVDKSSPA